MSKNKEMWKVIMNESEFNVCQADCQLMVILSNDNVQECKKSEIMHVWVSNYEIIENNLSYVWMSNDSHNEESVWKIQEYSAIDE